MGSEPRSVFLSRVHGAISLINSITPPEVEHILVVTHNTWLNAFNPSQPLPPPGSTLSQGGTPVRC